MKIILFLAIFSIVLISFLANPAPQSIEVYDLILIALPSALAMLSIALTQNYVIHQKEFNLLIAILLYISYLLISVLMAFLQGVPILNVLRAIGPYINFVPLLFVCLLPENLLSTRSIAFSLLFVGLLQALYQISLYFSGSQDVHNALGVLRGRITLIEPRTTLPIVFSVAILPIAAIIHYKNIFIKMAAVCLIAIGFFSGAVTLTRAIILSIFCGWIIFWFLVVHYHYKSANLLIVLRKFLVYMAFLFLIVALISSIPKIYILEQGIWARFQAPNGKVQDYSNGRINNEWIPAVRSWTNSGILSLFFGIGAGNTFTTESGEERSYIHNLTLYHLVYGGLYGLVVCLWLYYSIFKMLLYRAIETKKIIYFSFAALFSSIFLYSQLFAIHKGLAYNTMLFLMIILALRSPTLAPEQKEISHVRN